MPTYVITAPDGKEYEVEAPEGASQDQVLAYAKANYSSADAPKTAAPATPERTVPESILRQLGLTARAGISGIAAVPAAMADFAVAPVNMASIAATGQPTFKQPSVALQDFLTQVGLPQPENQLERAVQTGTSAMTGTGAQAAIAQGSKVLAPLAQNVGQQVAASGTGGFAGQAVGETVATETESPLAGTIASLATGIFTGGLAAKGVQAGAKDRTPVPTLKDIKTRAQERYAEMEQQGVALKPKSILDMLNQAKVNLQDENFNPVMDAHKPVQQVLDKMVSDVGTTRVSFTKLEQLRSMANDLKTATDPATRKYGAMLVNEVDNYVGKLDPKDLIAGKAGLDQAVSSVQAARKDWRNLSRAQVLEDAFNVAEAKALDPKASENELLRRQLINMLADKRKMAFFTEREQNAIKSVVKGGSGDTLLSLVARFNPERNQIIAGGQTALALSSPYTAIGTAAAGYGADKFLGMTRSKAVQDLAKQIANNKIADPTRGYGWRGLLATPMEPVSEQDLELMRSMR